MGDMDIFFIVSRVFLFFICLVKLSSRHGWGRWRENCSNWHTTHMCERERQSFIRICRPLSLAQHTRVSVFHHWIITSVACIHKAYASATEFYFRLPCAEFTTAATRIISRQIQKAALHCHTQWTATSNKVYLSLCSLIHIPFPVHLIIFNLIR